MFKFATLMYVIAMASSGLVSTHQVVHEAVWENVGHVVHSAPAAVSHHSISQIHGKSAFVEPILAPAIKTTIHSAAVLQPPVVHAYSRAAVLHAVPVLDTAPLLTVHH